MPSLDWIGKSAVLNHHREVPYHLLRCDPKLSVGDHGSGNLLVQGDNLLALKALLPYYAGKVKCIYIDPPYNTGNENWIYNDAVNSPEMRAWLGRAVGGEADDLSRHDKWLCMMYPRLALLREFMTDDGSIFVSIDDNEVGHLSLLMSEIFGPRNFVVDMIWQKMDSPSSNFGDRPFSNYHDHTLVFAKNIARCVLHALPKPEILDAYPESTADGNRFRLRQLRKNGKSARRQDRPTMWYPLTAPDGTEVWPVQPEERWEGRWAIARSTYEELAARGEIQWRKRSYGWVPYSVELAPKNPTIPNPSILTDVGQNRQAKAQLNEILGTDHGFDTPKPVGLVQRILQIASEADSIVLDSFAGSGTTGHAVLASNAADGGQRRFILVEADPGIATRITAERVRRVCLGYATQSGAEKRAVEGLGGSFRFCALAEPLFDASGHVAGSVRFADLARHLHFVETGTPLARDVSPRSPLIGVHNSVAYYLLFNGVLGDSSVAGGNVLTDALLRRLPKPPGAPVQRRVIYGEGCRLSAERLRREGIAFKQVPYQIEGG